MKSTEPRLLLTTSPFLKKGEDTAFIMWQVVYSLIPVVLAAIYFFGLSALLVTLVCMVSAVMTEWIFNRKAPNSIKDGSVLITGILLALTLPPGIALWMASLGGVVSVLLGKLIFGGIGYNIFNPALVGRAFLQAAFPEAMTTWAPYSTWHGFGTLRGDNLALPFIKTQIHAVTSATPLAKMKFEAQFTDLSHLLLGTTSGSLGETCALIILLSGIYMAIRNILNWRIPVSIFLTVYVFAAVLNWIDPAKYPPPLFHLLAGGLVLGAVFMATDPVTSPISQRGCWIFGFGIGVLVMIIRIFGGLPEGVMYAILLMNAVTPLINRLTQPRIYGAIKE